MKFASNWLLFHVSSVSNFCAMITYNTTAINTKVHSYCVITVLCAARIVQNATKFTANKFMPTPYWALVIVWSHLSAFKAINNEFVLENFSADNASPVFTSHTNLLIHNIMGWGGEKTAKYQKCAPPKKMGKAYFLSLTSMLWYFMAL